MAFTLNKVMLIGKLIRDAETRFSTDSFSITSFSIPTEHSYKGKNGDWVRETTWHNISAFNVSDYMKGQLVKGKNIYVEGRIKKRDYTDKDGVKRNVVEIVSEKLIPLDTSGDFSSGSGNTDFGSSDFNTGAQSGAPDMQIDSNDDLPF